MPGRAAGCRGRRRRSGGGPRARSHGRAAAPRPSRRASRRRRRASGRGTATSSRRRSEHVVYWIRQRAASLRDRARRRCRAGPAARAEPHLRRVVAGSELGHELRRRACARQLRARAAPSSPGWRRSPRRDGRRPGAGRSRPRPCGAARSRRARPPAPRPARDRAVVKRRRRRRRQAAVAEQQPERVRIHRDGRAARTRPAR